MRLTTPRLKAALTFAVTATAGYLSLATSACGDYSSRSVEQEFVFNAGQGTLTIRVRAIGTWARITTDEPVAVGHHPVALSGPQNYDWPEAQERMIDESTIGAAGAAGGAGGATSDSPAFPVIAPVDSSSPTGDCYVEEGRTHCLFRDDDQAPPLERELDLYVTLYRQDSSSSASLVVRADAISLLNGCSGEPWNLGVTLEEVR